MTTLPVSLPRAALAAAVAAIFSAAAHAEQPCRDGHGHGPGNGRDELVARDDLVVGRGTLFGAVLANDRNATAITAHTAPAHGTLALAADGTFTYKPDAGFRGTDSFTYTVTDAVEVFPYAQPNGRPVPALASVRGPNGTTTVISGEGFGSSLAPSPGRPGVFFGLTDRGPNADAPDGNKSEMLLDFSPKIGELALIDGQARLLRTITLKGPKSLGGTPYSGRPPHDTAEVIDDVDATNANGGVPVPVAKDPYGYDSEGLVAMRDGTFWVSDEYGPYVTHFDRDGYEIGRLTPYTTSVDNASHAIVGYLPPEYAKRLKNKGMEGLTLTPDGKTLVGAMQSALQMPDLGSTKAAGVAATRIITIDLKTFATKQYLYLLDDPLTTGDANSEITAISNTKFLVDERDGNFEPGAHKTLYRIDISKATDISGVTIAGKSPEAYVGTAGTAAAQALLASASIQVAPKTPYLAIGDLVTRLDPTGALYAHDKVEGVATTDGGRTLYISNDNDFGIDTIAVDPSGLWTVHQKVLPPTGEVDDGVILKVDMARLPATVKTATVTLKVK